MPFYGNKDLRAFLGLINGNRLTRVYKGIRIGLCSFKVSEIIKGDVSPMLEAIMILQKCGLTALPHPCEDNHRHFIKRICDYGVYVSFNICHD